MKKNISQMILHVVNTFLKTTYTCDIDNLAHDLALALDPDPDPDPDQFFCLSLDCEFIL
ncbi:MAG: hypothetical protein KKA84_04230 [Bacteroidetes bacterium]|nr:hypothetical protein [Bacteroidota bacterium]